MIAGRETDPATMGTCSRCGEEIRLTPSGYIAGHYLPPDLLIRCDGSGRRPTIAHRVIVP